MRQLHNGVRKCVLALLLAAGLLLLGPPAHAQGEVRSLKVLSFNVWVGGTNVSSGETKVRDAIIQSGADIVAMQESNGMAARLATQLGWYSVQPASSVAVLSRYRITQTLGVARNNAGVGVRVQLNSSPPQDVIVWSAHLTAYPYAPYDACLNGLSPAAVIRNQERTQLPEAQDIVRLMAPFIGDANNIPVFLIGDFNTPSHLDWTAATTDLHCGYSLNFPVTVALQNAGLIDAYRRLHPDPRQTPGVTWSPIYQTFVYPDGKPEPLDRIDMVHYAGTGVTITGADVFVVGTPQQIGNHTSNTWPSDHAGVLVSMNLVPGGGVVVPPLAQATLALNKTSYAPGEKILATFGNGPGNAKDWIGVYKSNESPGGVPSTVWSYTNGRQSVSGSSGPTSGTVSFTKNSKPVWPLPVGQYRAYFLASDGYDVLAGPIAFEVR